MTGIVLSGGKSSRMGKEKGLCLLKGKPLIEYSIELLLQFCETIIISSNKTDYDYLGHQIVKDEITGIGPAAGIFSCLQASGSDENFVLSCDTPMISIELIRIILSHDKKNTDALIPVYNGFPEPLSALYRKSCLPAFVESINDGQYKIQDILKKVNVNFVELTPANSIIHPLSFTNVNTSEDIMKLEKQMFDK
jgi:molybdenum cofactor guanylyltransferase